MLIHNITLQNLLSFGPDGMDLPLRPLNVLIGPNGSGKSNLIEAISLLQAAPRNLASAVRESGGIGDWLWKGAKNPVAMLQVVVESPDGDKQLRHLLAFTKNSQRFEFFDERIEDANSDKPFSYYWVDHDRGWAAPMDDESCKMRASVPNLVLAPHSQDLQDESDRTQSVLSRLKDPQRFPQISYLAKQYERIRIYRDWSFGHNTPPRQPQRADQENDFLREDFANLGLVLNRFEQEPALKAQVLENLSQLYPGVDNFGGSSIGDDFVQVFIQEENFTVPATRLSDGTLRYLCLLALLCHPKPPPLMCIEEPELGLHPDVMPTIAELLKDASTRSQLIVSTHSQVLVDALSFSPEDVVVCEKQDGQSTMQRLDAEELKVWLEKYALGQLWRRGDIGGNRW
ncbi:MAG: AAA family ATPase [Candidatus Nealsonbacteria bacterium]|nr:AAA family ATPase [Candidatus Nealsonbacteria bacterium]